MSYPDENGSAANIWGEPTVEFENLFRNKVRTLWQEECFVDVTLACDDKILTAHKLVLAAYSDYFKRIFSSIEYNQHPVVFMKDVSFEVLQGILEFMYCGEVNVSQYNLKVFMKTARNLKIKGLSMEGSDEEEREYLQKKRKICSQGSSSENRQIIHTPPVKKKKTYQQQEQSYYEDKEDEMNNPIDGYREENSSLMTPHFRVKARNLQEQQSSHNDNILKQRRNNSSVRNCSQTSQQGIRSLQSITNPSVFPGSPNILLNNNKETSRMTVDPSSICQQNLSDNEKIPEKNLGEGSQNSSQTANSRSIPVEYSEKDANKLIALKLEPPSKSDSEELLDKEGRNDNPILEQFLIQENKEIKRLKVQLSCVESILTPPDNETNADKPDYSSDVDPQPSCSRVNQDPLALHQYIPEKFSFFIQPLLEGNWESPAHHKKMISLLAKEIMAHLRDKGLIESNDNIIRRNEYRLLEEELTVKYPHLITSLIDEVVSPKQSRKGCHSDFIKKLAGRRRQEKFQNKHTKGTFSE